MCDIALSVHVEVLFSGTGVYTAKRMYMCTEMCMRVYRYECSCMRIHVHIVETDIRVREKSDVVPYPLLPQSTTSSPV